MHDRAATRVFVAPEGDIWQPIGYVADRDAQFTQLSRRAPTALPPPTIAVDLTLQASHSADELRSRLALLYGARQRFYDLRVDLFDGYEPCEREHPVELDRIDISHRPLTAEYRYRTRADHARARRRYTELQRRDRRRRRHGRPPIGPLRPTTRHLVFPRMQVQPSYPTAVDAMSAACRNLELTFIQAGQAVRQFSEDVGPALAAMQRRINENMQALAAMTVPLRPWHNVEAIATEVLRDGPRRHFAIGGVIHEHRDPADDSIPVLISPGEARVTPAMARRYGPLLLAMFGRQDTIRTRDVTHHDRWLGEGALERDETSSIHSTDSSGTGAVWSDLIGRIDELVDEDGADG